MAILATAATLLGHPALAGQLSEDDVARWADSIADSLQGHPDAMAVAGWPAVILGSKDRFIGLAHLAAGRPSLAATHLARAVDQNAGFAVLKARALFDLARALMMQSPGTAEGGAAMRQAWQLATDLGMANLVRQAAAKLAP